MTLLRYPYKKLYWIWVYWMWVNYLATVLRNIKILEHRIETLYLKSWNIAVLTVNVTKYWNIELEWISYCVTKQTAPAEKYALLWPWLWYNEILKDWTYEITKQLHRLKNMLWDGNLCKFWNPKGTIIATTRYEIKSWNGLFCCVALQYDPLVRVLKHANFLCSMLWV